MIILIAGISPRVSLQNSIRSHIRNLVQEAKLFEIALVIAFVYVSLFWSGNALAETVIYRVNSGGALVSATPDWEADTKGNPSTIVNAAATGNKTFSMGTTIDLNDPSIPIGTPEAIFQSERWDPGASPEMQWDFPLTPGSNAVMCCIENRR